jgi:hypothetical protein
MDNSKDKPVLKFYVVRKIGPRPNIMMMGSVERPGVMGSGDMVSTPFFKSPGDGERWWVVGGSHKTYTGAVRKINRLIKLEPQHEH